MDFKYASSLKISESNLIDIYNSVPRTLSQSAIVVSVNQDSEKRPGTTNISFQEETEGNYWIIAIDKTTGWLFPKGGQIFDVYQYHILIQLFDCSGYGEQQKNKEFILKIPAKVSFDFDRKEWLLENKGVLKFGDNSPTSRLNKALEEKEKLLSDSQQTKQKIKNLSEQLQQSQNLATQSQNQLEELKKNHEKLIDILSEIQQEKKQQEQRIQFLESSVAQERQKSQQQQAEINDLHRMFATIPEKFKSVNKKYQQLLRNDIHSTQQELDNLKNIITNLIHEQSQHSHDIISESAKLVQIISESAKLVQESFSKIKDKNRENCIHRKISILYDLVNIEQLEELIFNYNTKKISKFQIIKVAAGLRSIERRRVGDNRPLILTEEYEDNETFWILPQSLLQYNYYFLVPKFGLIINDRIYQTIEDIFICQGHENRASNHFQLMLPALVKSRSNNEWELIESGELLFEEKGML